MDDCFHGETAAARKRVENAERPIKREQEDMRRGEYMGLTTSEPEKTFVETIIATRDSMSDLSSFNDEDDGEDDDDVYAELGKRSKDDEPS